jgi:hypothetical protein
MMQVIVMLIVMMAVLWLLALLAAYLQRREKKWQRTSANAPDYEAIADAVAERQRRRRRRVVNHCDPEIISPPRLVKRYPDGRRLEIYHDGCQVLYDRFGNIIEFKSEAGNG